MVKAIICIKNYEDALNIIKYHMNVMQLYHNYYYHKSDKVRKRVVMIIIIIIPPLVPHDASHFIISSHAALPASSSTLYNKYSSSTSIKPFNQDGEYLHIPAITLHRGSTLTFHCPALTQIIMQALCFLRSQLNPTCPITSPQ